MLKRHAGGFVALLTGCASACKVSSLHGFCGAHKAAAVQDGISSFDESCCWAHWEGQLWVTGWVMLGWLLLSSCMYRGCRCVGCPGLTVSCSFAMPSAEQ